MTRHDPTYEKYKQTKSGVGSYQTKSDTRWRVQLWIPTTKKVHTKSGFPSQAEAKRYANKLKHEIDTGKHSQQTGVTFQSFATKYVKTHPKLRDVTRNRCLYLLQSDLAHWNHYRLKDITPSSIQDWLYNLQTRNARTKSKRLSEQSVFQIFKRFKWLLNAAVKQGYIPSNPCNDIPNLDRPDDKPVPDVSRQQIIQLANAVPPSYQALILLAGVMGLRWSEAIAVTTQDIDHNKNTLRIDKAVVELSNGQYQEGKPKSKASNRTLILPSSILQAIQVHIANHKHPNTTGLLFSQRSGQYLRRNGFRVNIWLPAIKQTNLPQSLTYHSLRHIALTHYAQTGATIRELMEFAGHSSPTMAMRYQHAQQDRMSERADMIDQSLTPLLAPAVNDNVIPMRR